MKKITLLIFLFCFSAINSQTLWKKQVNSRGTFSKNELKVRKSIPKKYEIYSLNIEDFRSSLALVSKNSSKIILLPSVDGNMHRFSIKETSSFSGKLNPVYGYIKSFTAQGIDDPTAIAKISIGADGLHLMIMSGKHSTFYIDPYTINGDKFIAYERSSLSSDVNDFKCMVEETKTVTKSENEIANAARNADDSLLRDYRLALACTGEYAQFHINNQGVTFGTDAEQRAAVLSAMNTTMTRVNGVYERDLSVKMTIILNGSGDNDLIFLDAATDNLTNNSASTLINESQSICDNTIGSANYDIGHTFSTGAGGLAGLGVVCLNGQKGRGVTGTNSPINDPYDIDFVAHEIGHQFGGNHTFNNSCGGNRNGGTAVEPGSGSTIMAYAGICAPNVQNNSDDHFHSVSIAEMWAHIKGVGGCRDGVGTNTNNAIPTVDAGLDVNIPKSTPFVLRGMAADDDGVASLTYNWEQIDTEISTQSPLATNTGGPNFRSLQSSVSPDRYMPTLSTVIGGSTETTWEVIPSVARTLNFSLVVRDNNAGGGASARDDIEVTVTDADPFVVTSQSSNETWNTGSQQTITWDKSTTDIAPINCANVRIKLSTDGGVTFPITLVESTPNDGTHTLTVPNNPTTAARILVEGVGNIFYNVNSSNFTINSTTPTFVLTNNTAQQSACNSGGSSVDFTLNLDFVNGFSENVSFSTNNTPTGANVSFSPTNINSDGDVTMTVSNFDSVTAQLYTIEVTGTSNSTSVMQSVNVELLVLGDTFSTLALTTPSDTATGIGIAPELMWNSDSNATFYDVQVATDNGFSNIVASGNVNTNSYTVSPILTGNTVYFWRVKPKNSCGEGSFSSVFSFTTEIPSYCESTFSEATNSEWISNVTFNTLNNDSDNDHDANTDGSPDGYEDFTAISTSVNTGEEHQISVTFDTAGFQDHCYVFIDWNQDFVFNTTNERYDLGSHTNDVSTATFNITIPTDAADGNTRMRVVVEYDDPNSNFGEGPCTADYLSGWGETEDYTIEVQNPVASIEDFAFSGFNLYPNPSNGEINLAFEVINTDEVTTQLYDLRGRKVSQKTFKNVSTQFSEKLTYDNVSTGIYLLRISNGGKVSTRKIIIK